MELEVLFRIRRDVTEVCSETLQYDISTPACLTSLDGAYLPRLAVVSTKQHQMTIWASELNTYSPLNAKLIIMARFLTIIDRLAAQLLNGQLCARGKEDYPTAISFAAQ